MSITNNLKNYAKAAFEALLFYFKPGLRYQKYPGGLDFQKRKYFQVGLKCTPAARSGIRKVWHAYSQILLEKDIAKFKYLLAEVENMLDSIQGGKHFHISMTKSEEGLSLKKLAMNIYNEIGLLNEYQNYDEALDDYGRGARMLNRNLRVFFLACQEGIGCQSI